MILKDIWQQEIKTHDISESFPSILQQINQSLYTILLCEDDINTDIEHTSIKITYKIEKKKKNKRKKLKHLGKYKKIKIDEQHKECPICLENFKKGYFKRKMPKCKHEFHKGCIDKWLYQDKNYCCPICRTFQGNIN